MAESEVSQDIEILSSEPVIAYIDHFLTPEECKHLIALAKNSIKRALVSGENGNFESPTRTAGNTWLDLNADEITKKIASRISELVGIPLAYAEGVQVIYYGKGQEYLAHHDAYDLSTEMGRRYCEKRGQRVATALAYLNDVKKGGATHFPTKNISIAAREGRMAIFHNTLPGTSEIHPDSLHAGMPVDEGEKWALNVWFRSQPKSET